jgi:hypothetical protein
VCPLIFQVCPLIFQVCPLILGVCPLILGVCPLIPFNAPTKAQIKATNQSAQIKGHTWESQFYEVKSTKIKGHTLRGSFKGQHKGPLRQPPFWIALMGPSSPPPFSLSDALAGALTTWAAEARCIIICIETQLYDVHVYLYSTIRGKHALNGMDPGPSWAGRGEVVLHFDEGVPWLVGVHVGRRKAVACPRRVQPQIVKMLHPSAPFQGHDRGWAFSIQSQAEARNLVHLI